MRSILALVLLGALLAGCVSPQPAPPRSYPVTWSNPEGGTSGTAVPTRAEPPPSPPNCREFQQTITIAGRPEQAWGRACRQPDGSWRIVAD